MMMITYFYLMLISIASTLTIWPFAADEPCNPLDVECFGRELYRLYQEDIEGIEKSTYFNELVLPPLTESHFLNTKPIISLFGQYSSGKTTFVNLLINNEYSGQFTSIAASTEHITFINGIIDEQSKCTDTDNNICEFVDDNNIKKQLPDNSDGKYFVMNGNTPFNIYQYFSGTSVIKNMKAAFVDSPFLRDGYIIDTPGILTETKVSCDMIKFYNTLYYQSDLIIFIFDPYKPSDLASAETVFLLLKNAINKVKFVINKADSLQYRSLLDVYGSIQYNLGRSRIFESLEINRFYMTSLWNKQCLSNDTSLCQIVNNDKQQLLKEIDQLKNNRFKIESKIKSLSERIEFLKKHIKNIEILVSDKCDCNKWTNYCLCKKDNIYDNMIFDESSKDKNYICYNKNTHQLIENMEKKENMADIKILQYLHQIYFDRLNKAQQKLNKIAETLENS